MIRRIPTTHSFLNYRASATHFASRIPQASLCANSSKESRLFECPGVWPLSHPPTLNMLPKKESLVGGGKKIEASPAKKLRKGKTEQKLGEERKRESIVYYKGPQTAG